jgi:hypothetical protein
MPLRTAANQKLALETAAAAIEQRLIGAATALDNMTVAAMPDCVEGISASERQRILSEAGVRNDQTLLSRLYAGGRRGLARALRSAR